MIYEIDIDENQELISSEKQGSDLAKYGITTELPNGDQVFITGKVIQFYSKYFAYIPEEQKEDAKQ